MQKCWRSVTFQTYSAVYCPFSTGQKKEIESQVFVACQWFSCQFLSRIVWIGDVLSLVNEHRKPPQQYNPAHTKLNNLGKKHQAKRQMSTPDQCWLFNGHPKQSWHHPPTSLALTALFMLSQGWIFPQKNKSLIYAAKAASQPLWNQLDTRRGGESGTNGTV